MKEKEPVLRGIVTYVNHEKAYITIGYTDNARDKSVNYNYAEVKEGPVRVRKQHQFRVGDELTFNTRLSSRGDRMVAVDVKFLYNPNLEKLLNRAQVENRFAGYLKQVDGSWFVKEQETYSFFQLRLSKWERPPAGTAMNQAISFRLVNLDKPASLAAEPFSHDFIPEYRQALELNRNKKPVKAVVTRVSPFAVYLDLFGNGNLVAKLDGATAGEREWAVGSEVLVQIDFLSPSKIAVSVAENGESRREK